MPRSTTSRKLWGVPEAAWLTRLAEDTGVTGRKIDDKKMGILSFSFSCPQFSCLLPSAYWGEGGFKKGNGARRLRRFNMGKRALPISLVSMNFCREAA